MHWACAVVKASGRVKERVLDLPGLPKFLEQAGPVLVPATAEPSLDLAHGATRLFAQSLYRTLTGNQEKRFSLCQREGNGD